MNVEQNNVPTASLFLGLLLLPLVIMSFSSGGSSGGMGETSSWNAGTSSCTITAGSTSCSNTFTWPTPLAATPCAGCSEATATTATGGISDQTLSGEIASEYFFDEANDFVNGKWTTMPAATTELYGENGAHWLVEDWSNVVSADFVVNCHVNSNTVGATLNMQYSTDQGTTWASVGVPVDINALCGPNLFGHDGPGDSCYTSTGTTLGCFINVPAGAKVSGVFLRIVGNGGGGLGDNPDFTYAYVNVKNKDTTIKFAYNTILVIVSATQIGVSARINVVQSSSTTVNWKMSAWICIAGGSGPC